MPARQEPAHVAPQEAALDAASARRGSWSEKRVMVTMMRSPPDRAALHGGSAEQREHELAGARSLERAMREVAVIEAGDREHAHHVQPHCDRYRGPAHAGPERSQAGEMHEQERHDACPVDAIGQLRVAGGERRGTAVDPSQEPVRERCLARMLGAPGPIPRTLLPHALAVSLVNAGGRCSHSQTPSRFWQPIRRLSYAGFRCTDANGRLHVRASSRSVR